jgi:hypothetical protein
MASRIVLFAAVCGLFVLPFDGPGARAQSGVENADDLLIVDCLLPGKVRRLGRRVTFVTARKAIKTTASQCAIRGGEYTTAGRASFSTALKIWLPLANQGDPVAQTYVGEIYEKGLGVPPQFALAAQWYAKAAEKNFVRAQLSLGALYENGRGVPKDQAKAVEWYRKASGLGAAGVDFVPSKVKAELETLREEKAQLEADRARLEAERDALRQELDAIREKLGAAMTTLRAGEAKAKASRAALEAARRELLRDVAAGRQDRILEISKKMTDRSRELERSESQVATLKQRFAALQKQANELKASVGAGRRDAEVEIARYKAAARQAKAGLEQAAFKLSAAEKSVRAQRQRAETRRREVAALRRALATREQAAGADRKRESALAATLAEREQALAAERDRIAGLNANLSALRKTAGELEAETRKRTATEARLKAATARLAGTERALREQRRSSQGKGREVADLRAALARQQQAATEDKAREAALAEALAGREAVLAAERARVADLSRDVAALKDDTARLRGETDRRIAAEAELTAAAGRLAEIETALAAREKQGVASGAEIAALTVELAKQRRAGKRDKATESELRRKLAAREADLAAEKGRVRVLTADAGDLKDKAQRLQREADARAAAEAKQLAAGPVIQLIDPPLPVTRSADSPIITMAADSMERLVIGRVKGAGGIVALLVNDIERKPDDIGLFRMTVKLTQARTNVTIVAIDANGKRATTTFVLARKIDLARNAAGDTVPDLADFDFDFGDYYALVIGNNDYARLPKLKTAAGDAEAVAELLKSKYGYDVTLLLNATRYQILSALNKMREDLTEDDNLLIYYAGHGELDRVNNRGNWLPVDAEPTSTANWISNIQITDVLNAMSVRQALVVADSCYSGTLTRGSLAQLGAGMTSKSRANTNAH